MEDDDLLLAACHAKDPDALREALVQLNEKSRAPFLARLLLEDWHDSHEDIVFELGLIGDPCAIAPIEQAIVTPFKSLVEWGNVHAFQRKCTFALARIGTAESREALQRIAKLPDRQLQACAEEGLHKWPLPYEGDKYA